MNVLLDLDGTLTDPREGIVGCIRHALAELGEVPPHDADLVRYIGPPLRDAFRELLGDDQGRIESAVATYRARFVDVGIFENELYAGIPESLQALTQRDVRLFLATSKPRVYAERILDHLGLSPFFAGIHGSELNGALSRKVELIAHVLAANRLLKIARMR